MKDKIITFLFIGYILTFSILHILIKDETISKAERRSLSTIPTLNLNNQYTEKLEKYLLDHFPYRDELRSIKAIYNYKILNKLDNNQIYLKEDSIYKLEYNTNKQSIHNFINNTTNLKKLLTKDNHTYLLIIPDKNYYIEDEIIPKLDYNYLYKEINNLNISTIDIRDLLTKEDYYKTDTHWKQENLDKVVKRISINMNLNYKYQEYKKNIYNKFYGVYYGQSAIINTPEPLTYLTNDEINNAKVKYLENKDLKTVYNLEKLTSLDSYEVYLDGASSFIEITNPNNTSDKELIIFRDSFASSLAPLLINYYHKITLIDNRYINSHNLKDLIEFNNQDVIFMYSTLIVNNSYSLKN